MFMLYVSHFLLGSTEEINTFMVRAEETPYMYRIDDTDSKELLFGRKLAVKKRMRIPKPFTVDLGKPQWLKDLYGAGKHCGRPRYMEYFFGATREESIRNLIDYEKWCYDKLEGNSYYADKLAAFKERLVMWEKKYLS